MFTSIKKWLDKTVANMVNNHNNTKSHGGEIRPTVLREATIESKGLNFTVYRANGGYVIENRSYDRKLDRSCSSLHIITDDKDLGEEIGKIITFEQLRS
jgi:hypothetical protein